MAQIQQDVTLGRRYRLVSRIAAGGMGTVWEAEDTVLHRNVAVKVLSDALGADHRFVERFRREARAAAGLSHPNVAGVFDYGEDEGTPFIVLELIHGHTLADLIARGGRMPPADVARIGRDVAHALQAAHDAGVVHRDVKPGNVMITARGEVKVMDFGIASTTWGAPLTATGAAMGTASYISPEQASGEKATPASDVYALGCVLYELLTGRPPFQGTTPVAVATAHVQDQPAPLTQMVPGVPTGLAAAVHRALAKDPADRPPSAASFAAMLKDGPGAGDSSSPQTTQVLPAQPPTRTLTEPLVVIPEAPPASRPIPPSPRRPRAGPWILAGVLAAVIGLAVLLATLIGGTFGSGSLHPTTSPSAGGGSKIVPNVVGMSLPAAITAVTDAGFSVAFGQAQGPVGTVVRVDPPPGTSIRAGASVTLYVGTGGSGGGRGDHQDNGKGPKKKHGPGDG